MSAMLEVEVSLLGQSYTPAGRPELPTTASEESQVRTVIVTSSSSTSFMGTNKLIWSGRPKVESESGRNSALFGPPKSRLTSPNFSDHVFEEEVRTHLRPDCLRNRLNCPRPIANPTFSLRPVTSIRSHHQHARHRL
jgi:hypothetical protein